MEQARTAKELIEHALACPLDLTECPHARERIAARMRPVGTGRSRGEPAGAHRLSFSLPVARPRSGPSGGMADALA
jgi:hypothetical protein